MQTGNIQVLSTRILDEALLAKAAQKNLEIESVSFIETEPLNNEQTAALICGVAQRQATVVFTSMNAVAAVAKQLTTIPEKWTICCTGGITKEHVIHSFGEDRIVATAKNATLLADKIIAYGKAANVVFFCGDQRLNDLPETLQRHAIRVDEIVVYTTVQTPVLIDKNYDAILFFSPSAVHSFFELNTIATDVALFSIGKTTTAVIQTYCTNKVITSEWPGAESMIELLDDYFHEPVLVKK